MSRSESVDAYATMSFAAAPVEDRDLVNNLLVNIDRNRDGVFSTEEVRSVAVTLLASRKKVRSLKRMLVGGAIAAVLVCAALLGIMLFANETSKESHVTDGSIVDTDGADVKVKSKTYHSGLGNLDLANLRYQTAMDVKDADGVLQTLNIEGFREDPRKSPPTITVLLTQGYKVDITSASNTSFTDPSYTLVSPDGSRFVYFSPTIARRLQSAPQHGRLLGIQTTTSLGTAAENPFFFTGTCSWYQSC